MSITGTVKKWNIAKGWGFVASNTDESEYYVNTACLVGGVRLTEGAEVQFDEDMTEATTKKEKEFKEAGKKKAVNVSGVAVVAQAQGSLMGTVCEWFPGKEFGFILSTDGTKVYVHKSAFDGAKLQVGKTMTYDTQDVGHASGRQVAVNVAGPAVLARAGTTGIVKSWIFNKGYGFVEDVSGNEVFVHASAINDGWLLSGKEIYFDTTAKEGEPGKLTATNVSGPGVKDAEQQPPMFAAKGFKGLVKGFGKGRKAGGTGGKTGKKVDGEQKRKDVDGKLYSKAEFIEQYGGTKEWDAKETRRSPANGSFYTKEQFVAHFGGTTEWNAAGKSGGGVTPFNPIAAKKRGRGGGRGAK